MSKSALAAQTKSSALRQSSCGASSNPALFSGESSLSTLGGNTCSCVGEKKGAKYLSAGVKYRACARRKA